MKKFFKNLLANLLDWQFIPKVGDKVKVAVGFCSYENEGIVSSVYKDKQGGYCWIDQFSPKGKYIRSFTASFSYCVFKFL